MVREGLEVILIFRNSESAGRIYLNEVLKAVPSGKTLEEASKPLLLFAPDNSLLEALARLKIEGESMGLVLEDDKPAGVLFSDRVLQNLI